MTLEMMKTKLVKVGKNLKKLIRKVDELQALHQLSSVPYDTIYEKQLVDRITQKAVDIAELNIEYIRSKLYIMKGDLL